MILDWFDASKAKEFGTHLANFYIERIPLDSKIDATTFARKSQSVLGKMADQITIFKLQHKLNTYQKAQLGNAFKWRFKEAGFAQAHTKQLTDWLMIQIT